VNDVFAGTDERDLLPIDGFLLGRLSMGVLDVADGTKEEHRRGPIDRTDWSRPGAATCAT
jgi:hypothetical protein